MDTPPVACPYAAAPPLVPCPLEELAPLLEHLRSGATVSRDTAFPRGTRTADGRLDLCKQSLGPDGCRRVAEAVADAGGVRALLLGTNGGGDAAAESVAALLDAAPDLETAYLGCNRIGPAGAAALADAVARSNTLTGLWLKRNPVGDEGVRAIARALRVNRSVRVLDLVNTGLTLASLGELIDAVIAGGTVERVYLGGNGLGPEAGPKLSRAVRLSALLLDVNALGDAGMAFLADELADADALTELSLGSNGIGPVGAESLADAIRLNRSLETLSLATAPSTRVLGAARNDIGEAGRLALCAAVAESETLTTVRIDGPLTDAARERLARNRERRGVRVPAGVGEIRSVYR